MLAGVSYPHHMDIFSFYGTNTSTKGGWVTLSSLSGRELSKPNSNNYESYKNRFVKVRVEMVSPWSQPGQMGPLASI